MHRYSPVEDIIGVLAYVYLCWKIFRLRTAFRDHQAQCILEATLGTYIEKEVLFNWAPICTRYSAFLLAGLINIFDPLPLLGLLQLVYMQQGFSFSGSRNHQTVGWGKQTKAHARRYRQRPHLRSQETLTTTIRAATITWKKRIWTSRR